MPIVLKKSPPKFQINGLFEIPAETMNEALEVLKQCKLKIISANIYEVELLEVVK